MWLSHILHSARYAHKKQGLDRICNHTAEPPVTTYFNLLLLAQSALKAEVLPELMQTGPKKKKKNLLL
jgi:hypothetical protein